MIFYAWESAVCIDTIDGYVHNSVDHAKYRTWYFNDYFWHVVLPVEFATDNWWVALGKYLRNGMICLSHTWEWDKKNYPL